MTVRSPLWDALAIGAAFLLIGGVTGGFAAALACIGTLDREARPVLAARGWLAAREAAAMAWWHAHRLPLLGLLYPQRGEHLKEAGDGTEQADAVRELRQADRDPAEVESVGSHRDGHPALPPADAGDPAGGRLTHKGEDDLTGLSAEDTDTLSAIRAINAEHLVPTNEPPVHMCPPDGGDGLMPCCGDTPFEHRADRMTLDPALVTCITGDQARRKTSGPGGLPGAIPPAPAATGQPGPEAGPPGPASAGGPPFAPVTTASCAAEDIAAKGDSTGPGAIIICGECPPGRSPAGPGPDQLSRLISGYLGAAEAMLPAWGQVLACSMRRELTAAGLTDGAARG